LFKLQQQLALGWDSPIFLIFSVFVPILLEMKQSENHFEGEFSANLSWPKFSANLSWPKFSARPAHEAPKVQGPPTQGSEKNNNLRKMKEKETRKKNL
jgi:hypothetical protein